MNEAAAASPHDAPVRTVHDAQGHTWYAYPVIEVRKLGAPRRASWLCLECGDDRRFITPIPEGWQQWSDAMLLRSIVLAKPDLRGDARS